MSQKFRFNTRKPDGSTCCSTDDPRYLCSEECRNQAGQPVTRAAANQGESLARFTRGSHAANCTGCPACNADLARTLRPNSAFRTSACTCDECQAKRRTASVTAAGATPATAPPPPDLHAAIRAAQAPTDSLRAAAFRAIQGAARPVADHSSAMRTAERATWASRLVPCETDLNALIRAAQSHVPQQPLHTAPISSTTRLTAPPPPDLAAAIRAARAGVP
jgi:hypothetical protein